MSARATMMRQGVPFVFGVVCLLALVALIEALIRVGLINPFIVPKPTDIVLSFERIIVEENILPRFFLTCGEALAASLMLSVVGISRQIDMMSIQLEQNAAQGRASRIAIR